MRYKRSKLLKLERSRYSVFTEDLSTCIECFRPKQDLNEIFGGGFRQASMRHGYVIPMCRECHEYYTLNPKSPMVLKWRIKAQKHFEKSHTRKEFILTFGKSRI